MNDAGLRTDRPLHGWPLALLCLIYLLAGLGGHDPWKNEDAANFGVVYDFITGHDWLVPHLAGEPYSDSPPLYHWLAASIALAAGWLLPLPDAARLATAIFAGLFLFAIARAGRALHGQEYGPAGILVAIGSLGLLVPLHATQPESALLAGSALFYWGLIAMPDHGPRGGLLAGSGIAIAFLATGLVAIITLLPVLGLVVLAPSWRSAESRRGILALLLTALPLVVIWPLFLAWHEPQSLANWWSTELAALHARGNSTVANYAELLAWFSWPALPLAIWALWRHRRHLTRTVILLPLAGTALNLVLLVSLRDAKPLNALPLLVPLILLATDAAGQMRRGAANAFDWFGMMSFSLAAFLVWLGGVAMVVGIPAQIQHNFDKLAPGFVASFAPLSWAIAAALTIIWIWHVWRAPRSRWRAITHWAAGVTLTWALIAALWFPWIDYGKSYRGVVLDLKRNLPEGVTCLAGKNLSDAFRASLHYFGNTITLPAPDPTAEKCPFLLEQGTANQTPTVSGNWLMLWESHRPGDRDERLRLYRRPAAE